MVHHVTVRAHWNCAHALRRAVWPRFRHWWRLPQQDYATGKTCQPRHTAALYGPTPHLRCHALSAWCWLIAVHVAWTWWHGSVLVASIQWVDGRTSCNMQGGSDRGTLSQHARHCKCTGGSSGAPCQCHGLEQEWGRAHRQLAAPAAPPATRCMHRHYRQVAGAAAGVAAGRGSILGHVRV